MPVLYDCSFPEGTKFRPLLHNVVIEVPRKSEKTSGGIFVPEVTQSNEEARTSHGKVVAIGVRAFIDNYDLKDSVAPRIGDEVVFFTWAGNYYECGSEAYRIVPDDKIIAIMEYPENNETEK